MVLLLDAGPCRMLDSCIMVRKQREECPKSPQRDRKTEQNSADLRRRCAKWIKRVQLERVVRFFCLLVGATKVRVNLRYNNVLRLSQIRCAEEGFAKYVIMSLFVRLFVFVATRAWIAKEC